MPSKVQIEIGFEAKLEAAKRAQAEMDALNKKLKEAGVSQSAYNKVLTDVQRKQDEAAEASKRHRISVTDLYSGFQLATQGLHYLKQGYEATVGSAMEYAEQVRDLTTITGTGAEETSRFLQVLDDFQLSSEDVTTAVRKMTQQGLVPNINTLAKLSDEYNSITDAQERNKFILDNLGRSGLQWVNVLKQGGDALRKMSGEVNTNLVLTDKQIRQSEEYRLALDELSDAWQGVSVAAGNALIPDLTAGIWQLTHAKQIFAEMKKLQEEGYGGKAVGFIDLNNLQRQAEYNVKLQEGREKQKAYAVSVYEATTAQRENAIATGEATQLTEEQIKAISESNQLFINTLHSIEGPLGQYNEGIKQVKENFSNAEFVTSLYREKVDELRSSYQNGQLSSAEYGKALSELQTDYHDGTFAANEQKQAVNELAAEYESAMNRIALSMVETNLARDGWTNAEREAYLNAGKALGVYNDEQIKAAKNAFAVADKITNLIDPVVHVGERARDAGEGFNEMGEGAEALGESISSSATPAVAGLKSAIAQLQDKVVNIDVYIRSHGGVPGVTGWQGGVATVGGNAGLHPGGGGQQMGGEVYAGRPYLVGEAGPEPFIPAQNGRILSHSEALHALTVGGGMGGANYGPFYGPVTLQIGEEGAAGLMSLR